MAKRTHGEILNAINALESFLLEKEARDIDKVIAQNSIAALTWAIDEPGHDPEGVQRMLEIMQSLKQR
jgi:hypothetical protein